MERRLRIYRSVYSRPTLLRALTGIDRMSVGLTAMCYIVVLGFALYYDIIGGGLLSLSLLLITAIPFIIVSLLRRVIDLPRPYDVMDIAALGMDTSHRKTGRSFPSRHVFSAFSIGGAVCFLNLPLGIILLFLGTGIAVSRVLRGIHFLRDVITGALIGAGCSVIGMLTIVVF